MVNKVGVAERVIPAMPPNAAPATPLIRGQPDFSRAQMAIRNSPVISWKYSVYTIPLL